MTGYRNLARNHDFTVLWVGQTLSELGSRVSMFVFPLLGYALTGSALVAALAEALHLLGLVGALLPAGVLADRVHRQRLMRWASATGLVLYSSLVAATLTGVLTVPHLLTVALLSGACAGLFAPAETAAVRTVVPDEDLPTALSQQQARQHVAGLVGGPLGGALYGVTRWLPFAFDAVSYAVCWVLLGRIRADLSAPRREGPPQAAAAGPRRGPAVPGLAAVLPGAAVLGAALQPHRQRGLLRRDPAADRVRGRPAGARPGRDRGRRLRHPRRARRAVADRPVRHRPAHRRRRLELRAADGPARLLEPPAPWSRSRSRVGVFLNPAGNAGIGAYRVAVTPRELLGRVQATVTFTSMSIMPLAPVLAGLLLATLGGGAAVAVLIVLCALVALIPTLSRSVRAIPRPEVWQAELAAAPIVHDDLAAKVPA